MEKTMKEPKDKRTKKYKEWKVLRDADVIFESINNIQDKIDAERIDRNILGEPRTEEVGLGDVVESITKATGIDKLVKAVVKDCGCADRKKKWNSIKLFKKDLKPRCLTDEEFIEWGLFRNQQDWKIQGITLTHTKILYIWETYQDVFNVKVAKPCTNCSPKPIVFMIENIDKLYNESK